MKRNLLYLLSLALLAACSAPKYSYNFDHYNYNAGKKKITSREQLEVVVAQGPDEIRTEELTATAEITPVLTEESKTVISTEAAATLSKKYKEMTKTERKEFRKEVKQSMKNYMKAKKSGDHEAAEKAIQAMDNDIKMAIIFGAVGLTLTLFGGVNEVFWIIGVIAIVIGVVFLVKWLVRQ